jgi:hypothetical protein
MKTEKEIVAIGDERNVFLLTLFSYSVYPPAVSLFITLWNSHSCLNIGDAVLF